MESLAATAEASLGRILHLLLNFWPNPGMVPKLCEILFLPKIEAQQGYLVCSFQIVSLARISRMVGEHVNLFLLSGNGRRRGELTYFFSLFPWPHQEAFGILSP